MSSAPPACLRCHAPMALGFLLESGSYDAPRVTQWVEGAPEESVWTGLRLKDRAVLAVSTYRCTRCGYLESYARADVEPGAPRDG